MAISVDWVTGVITVPKADTVLSQSDPYEIRTLYMNEFRLALKDLEDGEGMPFADTHRHIAPIVVGAVTLARVVEIINGYTVTFEDGTYAVDLQGANTNLADLLNLNAVQVRSNNSAGLASSTENAFTSTERMQLQELYRLAGLESARPVYIPAGAGTIAADGLAISVTGDCETGHTLARQ